MRVGVCVLHILGASGACGGVWHAMRFDVRCRPNSCITVLCYLGASYILYDLWVRTLSYGTVFSVTSNYLALGYYGCHR